MQKILLASKNRHKLEEIKQIVQIPSVVWVSMDQLSLDIDVVEDGDTFEQNAVKKAKEIYSASGIPCVADDSGLEVDALQGEPGVLSARYAGEGATTADNNRKLIEQLAGKNLSRSTARFHCVAAFFDGEITKTFVGITEGIVITQPRGEKGFGYDPLFIPDGYTGTFAELGEEIKNKISHRAKAFRALASFLNMYVEMKNR
ncbi:MAG: XTP/dITP diphosphatase [Calditrichia bacterium]